MLPSVCFHMTSMHVQGIRLDVQAPTAGEVSDWCHRLACWWGWPVLPDRGTSVLQAAARAVLAAAVKPEEREVALNVTGEEAFARRARSG